MNKNLLLHTCCAPCSTSVLEKLMPDYNVTGYFYNPNIYPFEEYKLRKEEAIKYFNKIKIELIIASKYETRLWFETMQNLEETQNFAPLGDEPEGGKRCQECYRLRLQKTAELAKELDFNTFTTTLTVSPHKNAKSINEIGYEIGEDLEIEFLVADFKKENGFKRSVELSKKHKLRRQDYCGCIFSKMQNEKRKIQKNSSKIKSRGI